MFFLSHLIYSFSVTYGNTQSLFCAIILSRHLNPKLELGISKSAVLQNFKAKGYTLTFDGRFYEKTKLVSFGGMTWTNLCIKITTSKFSEFWVFTTNATKYQYEQVYESINKKYSKYRKTDKPIPWYDDGRTIVYITYVPSRKYRCLSYCDKKLLYKSIAIDESEL